MRLTVKEIRESEAYLKGYADAKPNLHSPIKDVNDGFSHYKLGWSEGQVDNAKLMFDMPEK